MTNAQQPTTTSPEAWHAYIRSAPNFASSQERMEAAVIAGVDFAAMSKFQ